MPKYKNSGLVDVALGDARIAPNEEIDLYQYFDTLPAGVTKTADLPCHNPVVVSDEYSGNNADVSTITIPVGVDSIKGNIEVTAGSAEVYFNSQTNTPAREIALNKSYSFGVRGRLINTVIIKFTAASSKALVNIERS